MQDDNYEPAHFLNVDLVVDSDSGLEPFIDALKDDTILLFHGQWEGRWRVVLELLLKPSGPEIAIQEFANLVKRLPRSVRRLWTQAYKRMFDIGIQGGFGGMPLELEVDSTFAGAAAKVGAGIQITAYAPVPVSPPRGKKGRKKRRPKKV